MLKYKKTAPETIQAMFASIASGYDRANSLFSLGLHKKWNQHLIEAMKGASLLLDLCAGAGEIALGFLHQNLRAEAILLDFCPEMLALALQKGSSMRERFEIVQADAQCIPLHAEAVDGVAISYGIRNIQEPSLCLAEIYRVLQKQGKLGILELTRPQSPLVQLGHKMYTHTLLPLLGKIAAKNIDAYKYLASSVYSFPPIEHLEKMLCQVGFHSIEKKTFSLGVVTLITAIK